MMRALVFGLVGPVLGVLIAFYLVGEGHRDPYGVPIVLFFSLFVCPIAGTVDGVLAYVVPIYLRVPLTATVGAASAAGLSVFLFGGNLLHTQLPVAIVGALCMAICSLLSHDYNVHRRTTDRT
ncbi:hypothetical protein [Bradyrhizobium sp.]|uniref:hypothetical protein n=1 Tax=Bradyrhizobium sp. TaxID=376 RepID=UPI002727D65A|nr:hypothetical protein [Bradyrhizobium sp.]MDO9298424.1 hypothetical protein [Bradyrhizobium sp.]